MKLLKTMGVDIINFNKNEDTKKIFEKIKDFDYRSKLIHAYSIYSICKSICDKRKGNLAEVGVGLGLSAKLICEAKGKNILYLFDMFGVIPNEALYGQNWNVDWYTKNCSLDKVTDYLEGYKQVEYFCGYFPDSVTEDILKKKFIFVHLDVDLHESTKKCLEFFYPRMEKGGVILSHDYGTTKERKIYDDFFKDKDEIIIDLFGGQAMIIKL